MRVIGAISDTKIPSNGEKSLQLGNSHHLIHSNSVQNPTEINLDEETMDSPSGEYYKVPPQSSRLIPKYVNLCISGLSRRKIIQ